MHGYKVKKIDLRAFHLELKYTEIKLLLLVTGLRIQILFKFKLIWWGNVALSISMCVIHVLYIVTITMLTSWQHHQTQIWNGIPYEPSLSDLLLLGCMIQRRRFVNVFLRNNSLFAHSVKISKILCLWW